jgi:hypothetical protein
MKTQDLAEEDVLMSQGKLHFAGGEMHFAAMRRMHIQ